MEEWEGDIRPASVLLIVKAFDVMVSTSHSLIIIKKVLQVIHNIILGVKSFAIVYRKPST